MQPRTHLATNERLVGRVLELSDRKAKTALATTPEMAVDDRGLVHGGFVFGLADYAAMLAVNDPNVVLGGAEVRFLAPVSAGEEIIARADVTTADGTRRQVDVSASVEGETVFLGSFTCFVLATHVFDHKKKDEQL